MENERNTTSVAHDAGKAAAPLIRCSQQQWAYFVCNVYAFCPTTHAPFAKWLRAIKKKKVAHYGPGTLDWPLF